MEKLKNDIHSTLGIRLSPDQEGALAHYEEELVSWNERLNLTAISDTEGIRTKHFLDSLTCLLALGSAPPNRLIDIGTGAGFPGIPLKIILPDVHIVLLESVRKKTRFLRHIVQALNLEKVEVVRVRAEEAGQDPDHREQYDCAVARAVASMPTLVEYMLPLVRVGGTALAQKGEGAPAEAHSAERAINLLGGHLRQLQHITLPGVTEDRYLVTIDKVAATPGKYPRRPGIPSKRPL